MEGPHILIEKKKNPYFSRTIILSVPGELGVESQKQEISKLREKLAGPLRVWTNGSVLRDKQKVESLWSQNSREDWSFRPNSAGTKTEWTPSLLGKHAALKANKSQTKALLEIHLKYGRLRYGSIYSEQRDA